MLDWGDKKNWWQDDWFLGAGMTIIALLLDIVIMGLVIRILTNA